MPTNDSAVSSHKRTTRIYYIERLGSTLNLKGGALPHPTLFLFFKLSEIELGEKGRPRFSGPGLGKSER